MNKVFLVGTAFAQSTGEFLGHTFNITNSGSNIVYTGNSYWFYGGRSFKMEEVSLTACISDCAFDYRCLSFAYNENECYLHDVSPDFYQIDANTYNQNLTIGFILNKNPQCSVYNGVVTCSQPPDNSGLSYPGNSSNFQGFTMIVDRGMYSSTNCDYQQSFLVTGMPNSGSEGDCREFINGSNDSFAYSYDIKAQQCHLYDLQLQNLTMIRNSSSNCGFYLPSSKTCFDDGKNVQCTAPPTNNATTALESTSDSSKTGLIVGIVIPIILVVLGIAGYIYYKKQNRPSGNTRGTKLDYQKVANDRCQVLLDNEMAPDKNIAASKVVHVKGISDTAFQTDPCMFSINELKNTPLNVNPTQMPASNQFSNDSSPTTAVNSPTSSAVNRESGIMVLQQAIKRIQQENQIPIPPVMERKEISENTVDTAIPKAEDKHFIDPPKLAQHIPVAFCEPKLL